jgi:5-methylcytosine-specific restriction endonuclease McrA
MFSKQELKEAAMMSFSYRDVLDKLGYRNNGGNYRTVRKYIKLWDIDISHFTTKTTPRKRPTGAYLSNQYYIGSSKLRERLLKEGYFDRKCYKCNRTTWNDEPIPLYLHHKDGNHRNNNLSNLTILCPNCHDQSKTHKKPYEKNDYDKRTGRCIECGTPVFPQTTRCKVCYSKYLERADYPSVAILQKEVDENGYEAVGRKYGVSGNAIRKRITTHS